MKRILALDIDGTITKNFSWKEVHKFYETNLPDWTTLFETKQITMNDWTYRDLSTIMKKFKKEDIPFLLKRIKLKPDFIKFAEKWFDFFKKNGDVIFISGGFPFIVTGIAKKFDAKPFNVKFEINNGKLKIIKSMTGEHKKQILQNFAKTHNVIYVSDPYPKGYEPSKFGKNIEKFTMCDETKGKNVIKNFDELSLIFEKRFKQ